MRSAAAPPRPIAVLLGVALLAAGCGGDGDPVSGEFVGDRDEYAIAAVAGDAEGERTVALFVSDGLGEVALWYPPVVTDDDELTLTSADGRATASLALAADGAEGAAVLPGGETVAFRLDPAVAPAGLYDVTISGGGVLRGAAVTGDGRIDGRLGDTPHEDGAFPLEATVMAGGATAVLAAHASSDQPARLRVIAAPDADRKLVGGGETRRGAVAWVDPEPAP